ncbi:MAG TPA: ABC transporter permease [Candidatus Acidoferrales bacterium]|nr:ABC transporter permease [Candidatus Acidoferrales bacterium]
MVLSALTASLGFISYYEIIADPTALPDAKHLVSLLGVTKEKGMEWPGSWNTPAFSALGVFQTQKLNIGENVQRQETVLACLADTGFFDILGVGPELGRLLNKDDAAIGAPPVAVISDLFWKSHFDGLTDLSTVKFFAAGRWIQVVGVLPPKVGFPAHAAVYLPHPDQRVFSGQVANERWSADDISHGDDRVVARLKQGVSVAQANGMLKAVSAHLRKINTDPHHGFGVVGVRQLRDTIAFRVKGQLTTITVAGLFVGLVGLFSLLFLSAARAAELQKDVAIRVALGAKRGRLLRREIIWWFWIGAAASVAVLGCTALALRSARNLEGLDIPRLGDLSLSFAQAIWVVAGTIAVALLLALPYLFACRKVEPVTPILNRGESLSRLTVNPAIGRIVSIGQLSLALALTAVAVRVSVNYWRLATTAPGIDPSGVFVGDNIPFSSLNLGNPAASPSGQSSASQDSQAGNVPPNNALSAAANSQKPSTQSDQGGSQGSSGPSGGLLQGLLRPETSQDRAVTSFLENQEVRQAATAAMQQPGVASVALMEPIPYEPAAGGGQFIEVNGRPSDDALPLYFVRGDVPKTLGLRVLEGRWFDSDDERNNTNAIVVGNSLSQQYFLGRAIGKTIVVEGGTESGPKIIVGVVDDVVPNYGQGKGPAMYVPMNPRSPSASSAAIIVKMAQGMKRPPFPIRNVPGNLLQFQPWTGMEKMMSDAGAMDRASATVAAWFAILVLLLSAAGAYAVFWMITIQRQREMAIRICFGALPARVALGLVLNAIVLACCAGVGGFAIQQTMQRVLSSRIYQFPAFSWTTFLVSFGVITAATLLSVARPASSVLRISPAELLRDN